MSYQEIVQRTRDVAETIDIMINGETGNIEILVYYDEDKREWVITKDKRFFSNGYKLEDVIVSQEEEIMKLHNEIASLKSTIGHLMTQPERQPQLPKFPCPNCGYFQCRCFNTFEWNKVTCKQD